MNFSIITTSKDERVKQLNSISSKRYLIVLNKQDNIVATGVVHSNSEQWQK